MTLVKSRGNMYPWVTHMHSHLGGECPHKCSYCYVQKNRFGVPAKYQGELRLVESELFVNYGSGKTIFIEHMGDLFAEGVPAEFIEKILNHCREYQCNTYVFQTKNPARMSYFGYSFPENIIIGTTIESTFNLQNISKAPSPENRFRAFKKVKDTLLSKPLKTFVTIEPVIRFNLPKLVAWLIVLEPDFVNIGADSKGGNLPEPTGDEVWDLIIAIKAQGIEIREKHNLNRLFGR
jgi:DNA repair photolyase